MTEEQYNSQLDYSGEYYCLAVFIIGILTIGITYYLDLL